ncbi:MAG: SusC/RagA family TonB-linked outer membrane protein [Gemmatimonadales bacterium]
MSALRCQTLWVTLGAGLLLAAGITPLAAQAAGQIEGTVTEAVTERPLFGVRVQVLGTPASAVTDRTGRFVLRAVPEGAHTLRASAIGYARIDRPVTVIAGQSLTADFALNRVAVTLEEIVVTGTAGAQEKVTLGNTVGNVQVGGKLEDAPITNINELLASRVPGLTLLSNSGQTGSSSNIRIRGASSLSGGYQPVFYVDGVRIEAGVVEGNSLYQGGSALDFINPEDVESIEVIKGPAAATLYGADAANGVIQVITKKGNRGADGVQWTASAEFGEVEWTRSVGANTTFWRCTLDDQTDTLDDGRPALPGCYDPSSVVWWGKDEDGNGRQFTGIPAEDIIDVGDGTFVLRDDPLFRHPAALRVGATRDLNISARGGTGRMGYFVSFNENDENGVFYNNFFKRMGGRGNFDVQMSPTLDLSVQLAYVRSHLRQPLANNASDAVNRNGMRGRARATRDPWEPGYRGFSPFVSNEFDRQNRVERFTISTTTNWQPVEWFRNRLTVGLDRQSYRETEFWRQDTTGQEPWGSIEATGAIYHELPVIHRWTVDYAGSVDRDLTPTFNSVTSAGVQLNARTYRGYFADGEGLVANNLNLVGAAASRSADEQLSEQTSLGVYFQEQVGWRDRLWVTGALRIDDNSAFGSEFSLVTYPKFSVSWLMSDENFFRNWNLGWLDQVKLRFAWGKAGNAPAPFSADRTYTSGQGVRGDELVNSLTISEYGNPKLRAETGVEFETGFDASLFGGRAGIEFTYYNQHTKDALIEIPDPGSTGFTGDHLVNIGEISDIGVELLLRGSPVVTRNFTWDATLSLSGNRNRLVSFNGARDEVVFGSFADVQRHREGYPLGAFWAVDVERDAAGDVVLRDDDGNIVTDPDLGDVTVLSTCRWAPSDPTWNQAAECQDIFMGSSVPTTEASLTNTFTLFGSLRIFAQLDYRGDFYQWCAICSINSRIDLNTWDVNTGGTDLNPDVSAADVEALRSLQTKSHISRADFVKFRELAVTYTLPERWTRYIRAGSRWSLTLAGRNLAVWTKYKGRGDPEVQFNPNNDFTMLDYASTPQTRRLSVSMRVTF